MPQANTLGLCCAGSKLGYVNQAGHVAMGMLVLVHQLMGAANFIEAERSRQTRVYRARDNQLVEGSGLLIVGQVTTLKTFLHHPMVAKIQCHVVA
ncbi:uncharacterized protein METZ01_LOCUS400406, partial [marine metagenome]